MNNLRSERNGAMVFAEMLRDEGRHEEARQEQELAEWLDALCDIANRFGKWEEGDTLRRLFPPEAVARACEEWDREWTWEAFVDRFGRGPAPSTEQPV